MPGLAPKDGQGQPHDLVAFHPELCGWGQPTHGLLLLSQPCYASQIFAFPDIDLTGQEEGVLGGGVCEAARLLAVPGEAGWTYPGLQPSTALPESWNLTLFCPFTLVPRSLSPSQPMWDRDWAFASPELPFK